MPGYHANAGPVETRPELLRWRLNLPFLSCRSIRALSVYVADPISDQSRSRGRSQRAAHCRQDCAYPRRRHRVSQVNSVISIPRPGQSPIEIGNDRKLSIIAGPCQLESRQHGLDVSARLREIADRLDVGLIYKTSFDKANRTSASAQRGLGLEASLPVFEEIRETSGLPVLTDVHSEEQARIAATAVDVLQIPAFLCRQTDLLIAAAKTGKPINVKKGQFLAPWDMKNVIEKIAAAGNPDIMACERGASFGYNTLVSDMRSLPIMAQFGAPVVFDATHSVQQPGGQGTSSGGQREFVPTLARAAVAVGVAAVFIETHPDPDNAPSDGPNMVPLGEFEALVKRLLEFDALAKGY
ncbi:MAG: 3-deoxy-8-phosphooctulonate synthase [Maricaulis sp.]|nr:3-deoxy-8-phosphooctulonate synthase [Maricaulis sp.]